MNNDILPAPVALVPTSNYAKDAKVAKASRIITFQGIQSPSAARRLLRTCYDPRVVLQQREGVWTASIQFSYGREVLGTDADFVALTKKVIGV